MDDFPQEPPRFWIAFGIFVAALILTFSMMLYTAHAQRLCAPASQIIPAWKDRLNEAPIWEGLGANGSGPLEYVLTQSPSGSWSLFTIQSGIACLVRAGKNGNPNELGKGV